MSPRSSSPLVPLFAALTAAIAIVPWFHSPLTVLSQQVVGWLLCATALVFLIAAITDGSWPIPKLALVCWLLLLVQGWGMAINAQGIYELRRGDRPTVSPNEHALDAMPGALDATTSRRTMIQVTGLAGVFGCACLLGRSIRLRRRTLAVMLLLITCVAVEGLFERGGMLDIYETQRLANEGWGFASFNYHANAGAFLNLGFALACGGAVTAPRRGLRRAAHLVSAVICLAAVAATGSRGAGVISAGIFMATIFIAGRRRWKRLGTRRSAFGPTRRRILTPKQRAGYAATIIGGIVVVALLAAAVYYVSKPQLARWSTFPIHLSQTNPRLLLWKLSLPNIIHAGLFGVGPGGLKILLSLTRDHFSPIFGLWIFRVYDPAKPTSMWLQMHNDPLATIVEWGWLGALLWVVLVGGSLLRGRPDRARLAIGLAIAGCLLHGCFDFPMQVPAIQVYVAALGGLAWAGRGGNAVNRLPRRMSRFGR